MDLGFLSASQPRNTQAIGQSRLLQPAGHLCPIALEQGWQVGDDHKEVTKLQELTYELKVGDAMTEDVVTVAPQTTMDELREIMRVRRISGTPVLESGKLVGVVSVEDLINALADGEIDTTVGEKMARGVKTLRADEPLIRAVGQFARLNYGRFPVVNREGQLVGILTQGDIVRALLHELEVGYREEEIHRYRASHFFEDIVADETAVVFGYYVPGKDFGTAGAASSSLKTTLHRLGLSPPVIRRVAVATYEAEMNVVIYTDGGEIVAEVRPDRVRIEVDDTGPGILDIERAMQPGFSTAPEWVREMGFGAGMGLPNIEACSDVMRLDSTLGVGTRLEIIIHIDESQADVRA
jgi:CBS domain-containing protein/anti-sigma regulatory factor (Ser/Thr protein kinase)